MTTDSRIDHIAWAGRLNARWIVHNKLNATAAAYMDYVAKTDRERLARSCRLAHLLVQTAGDTEDPKPWFYGGLFSLATRSEAKRFSGAAFFAGERGACSSNQECFACGHGICRDRDSSKNCSAAKHPSSHGARRKGMSVRWARTIRMGT